MLDLQEKNGKTKGVLFGEAGVEEEARNLKSGPSILLGAVTLSSGLGWISVLAVLLFLEGPSFVLILFGFLVGALIGLVALAAWRIMAGVI